MIGAIALACGYVAAGLAPSLPAFALAQGALIGFGSAASFGPLIADISHWFERRPRDRRRDLRGRQLCLPEPSGRQRSSTSSKHPAGARPISGSAFSAPRPCCRSPGSCGGARPATPRRRTGRPRRSWHPILAFRRALSRCCSALLGVACCVAMAMPQVHIVAYCGDLGYGAARGAEMLSLMLRLRDCQPHRLRVRVADRIGGLATLLLGSVLQGLALLLYLMFDGLASLYVISGSVRPLPGWHHPRATRLSCASTSRRAEAGARLGLGAHGDLGRHGARRVDVGIHLDLTGSYRIAFLNGLAWNLPQRRDRALALAAGASRTIRPNAGGRGGRD